MNSRDETNGRNSDINLLFSTIKLPPLVKLAIISVDTHSVPRPLEVIVFVISQLQILSVFLRTTLLAYTDTSLTFYETFALVDKYLSVSPALDFKNNRSYSFFILGLPYIYIVVGVLLLFYVLRIIVLGKFPVNLLRRIWSIAIYLHPLIFFYPIHTISLRAISLSFSRDNSDSFGSHNALVLVQVTSCLTLVANLVWSIGVMICLSPPFKTRSVLATKTRMFGLVDMSIKAIFPVIWLAEPDSLALGIFLLILSLIFSLFKDGMFFRLLPYYNMSILRLAAKSYAFLTLYAFSAILSKAFSYTDIAQGLLLTVTVSILLAPVVIKLYALYLERIFRRIVYSASERTSPYYLSQYWHIYKDFIHKRGSLEIEAKKFEHKYFFYTILEKRIAQKNFDINTKEEDLKWGKQILEGQGDIFVLNNCVLSILITFLETSMKKNPQLVLPKASLAIYSIKYEHSYLRANQIIQEAFKNFPSYSKKVCYSLLWLKMMRNLQKVKATKVKAQNNTVNLNSQFNIKNYLSLYQSFEKLKNDIKAQLTPQLDFWKSFQLHSPDFGALIRLARTVNDKAAIIDVYVRNYLKFMEAHFLEPVLILGLYLSCVNNDVSQGEKLVRDYDRKKPKFRSKTNAHNFNEQIGLNNSLYFVVSASPHNSGQILSYSQSAAKMLCSKTDSLVGKSINIFAPSFLEGKGTHFLGFPINEHEAEPLDKPIQVQLIDKKGYLIHCWMYFSLEVLPKTGLSYCLLFNPATESESVAILKQNGTIAYYNEDFGEDMNIDGTQSKKELNIFSYCKELKIILRAFWHMWLHHDGNHVIGEVGRHMAKSLDKAGLLFHKEQGNKMPIQESDLERLFDRYSKGDYLIFHPPSHGKGEEDITLSFIDDHEHSQKTKIVYHANLRQVAHGKDMVVEMRLKKVSNAEAAIASFQLDSALLNKSSKPSTVVQSVFSTKLSQVRTNSLGHIGKYSVPAQIPNRRGSLFQREDQAQKGGQLLRMTDSEEFTDHKITELEQKIGSHDNNEDKTYLQTGSEVKLLKVSFGPSQGGKTDKKPVKRQMARQKTQNIYQKASQILQFEAPKGKQIENRATMEDGSTSISSKSRSARSEKVLKHILGARIPSKTRLGYLVYYIVTMAAFLVFLLWFSFNASAVSRQVDSVSEVLQNLYMRRFWTNLANQESRLWAGVRGGLIDMPGIVDATTETYTTNLTFHNMDSFNNAILQSVDHVNAQLQDMMMLKNVRIYTRDTNDNRELISTQNTFQATTEIVNEGFINVYTPLPAVPIDDYIQEASHFIFDNSNDDLLIASEALIAALADHVDNKFQTSENINTGVFAGGIAASISFVIASLVVIFMTMKEITRFMNILFTLPKEEAQHTEVLLLAFQDMLDKDYEGLDCIEALDSVKLSQKVQHQNQQQKVPAKKTGVKETSQTTNDGAMASMRRNNIYLFIKLLLPQVCLFLLSIYYYYWSINLIREMQSQQITINSALDNINTQSRISVQLQSMIMDNAATTIRNTAIIPSLTADIQKLEQIQALQDNFKDQNGNVPAKIQEIFANIDCNEVFSSEYLLGADVTVGECVTLAAGTDRIGLVNVITDEASQLTTFLQKFETSTRDTDTLGDLYREAVETFIQYFDIATTLFLLSYDITLTDFEDLVNNLESQGPILATIAVLFTVFIGLWNWFYGIKLLVEKEFDPKRVLSLVPTKIISTNRHLKSYIAMTAKLTEGQYVLR